MCRCSWQDSQHVDGLIPSSSGSDTSFTWPKVQPGRISGHAHSIWWICGQDVNGVEAETWISKGSIVCVCVCVCVFMVEFDTCQQKDTKRTNSASTVSFQLFWFIVSCTCGNYIIWGIRNKDKVSLRLLKKFVCFEYRPARPMFLVNTKCQMQVSLEIVYLPVV